MSLSRETNLSSSSQPLAKSPGLIWGSHWTAVTFAPRWLFGGCLLTALLPGTSKPLNAAWAEHFLSQPS